VGRSAFMFVSGVGGAERVAGGGVAFDAARVADAVEVMAAGIVH